MHEHHRRYSGGFSDACGAEHRSRHQPRRPAHHRTTAPRLRSWRRTGETGGTLAPGRCSHRPGFASQRPSSQARIRPAITAPRPVGCGSAASPTANLQWLRERSVALGGETPAFLRIGLCSIERRSGHGTQSGVGLTPVRRPAGRWEPDLHRPRPGRGSAWPAAGGIPRRSRAIRLRRSTVRRSSSVRHRLLGLGDGTLAPGGPRGCHIELT